MVQQQRKAQRLINLEQLRQQTHTPRAEDLPKLVPRQFGRDFHSLHVARFAPVLLSQHQGVIPKAEPPQDEPRSHSLSYDDAKSQHPRNTESNPGPLAKYQNAVSAAYISGGETIDDS